MSLNPRRWRALKTPATAALIAALASIAVLFAEPLSSIPNPRVRDGTWVTDMTGTLSAPTIARLNETIGAFERSTGVEMAVVVVRSLDGLSIEEAANKLFALWGIGKKDRDNGLLLFWATGDRRVRVEVGYGLEGVLPDGKVGAILDEYVIPKFKAGDFDGGILAGVDTLLAAARNEPVALPAVGTESYDSEGDSDSSSWLLLLPYATALPLGIGSLVGYRKWRRHRRRRCPECETRMVRLTETEDDALLAKGQLAEERIGSVDYDVWSCTACSHHFTVRYPKWFSRYDKCPQCSNRTKSSTEHTITAATTTSTGSARVVETCAFCTFTHEYTKVLPKIVESSSSSGSGSSSGSSFGGGSSGGGGASRGY